MIRDAIEKIIEIYGPKTITVPGADGISRFYSDKELRQVKPPAPLPICVSTLTGFCDYINAGNDNPKPDFVIIQDHATVMAVTCLDEIAATRATIIKAFCVEYGFKFNAAYDLESFLIGLQSCFVRTDNRDDILKAIGSVKIEKGITIKDDGFTQSVQTQNGISRVANVKLPNPVTLKPFRTFLEVDQPQSEFVFRISEKADSGAFCKLIEADGGAWKIEAMAKIKAYLKEGIGDEGITIIS
jgi:hypothetical protein